MGLDKEEERRLYRTRLSTTLIRGRKNIQNALHSLPNHCKGITDAELNELLEIRDAYTAILSRFNQRCKELKSKSRG